MDYVFETSEEMIERRYFVVICYDIYDNKRRRNFVKFASRYALRVQRSVFEGELSKNKYEDLISKVVYHIADEDNVSYSPCLGCGKGEQAPPFIEVNGKRIAGVSKNSLIQIVKEEVRNVI